MAAQTTRFTIVTRPELKTLADEIARENNISRSAVISRCLEELARKRQEELMIQYYRTMEKEHAHFAENSVGVIDKITSSWGD
jgi:hypothetical protein